MWFSNWLSPRKSLTSLPSRSARRSKVPTTRLCLEPLEDRTLLSAGWAVSNGGTGTFGVYQNISAPDAAGDFYVSGEFNGTATFGATTLNAPDGTSYVAKVDPNGNFLWATPLGNAPGLSTLSGITLDSSGNVYAVGNFAGTGTFGSYTHTADGSVNADIYVCKLDSNGNVLWVQTMGGPASDSATSVTTDSSGNVCVTGFFNSGSGSGNVSATFGSTTLTSPYGTNAFLSKLDSNGNFLWSEQLVPGNTAAMPRGISADSSGNVYVFGGTSSQSGFVDKVDASGNIVWTEGLNFGVYGAYANDAVYQDPVTGATSLYIGGFGGTIQKLNAASGSVLWTDHVGTTAGAVGHAITVDGSGNVYFAGGYSGSGDFDPGSGTAILNSPNSTFIVKLDPSGNFLSARSENIGNTNYNRNVSLALDSSGNLYTVGEFSGTSNFDTGSQTASLTSPGSTSLYLVKTTPDTGMIFGQVFNDLNNNGVLDTGEAGIPNVTVYLDLNNSGSYVAGDPTAITDSQGYYHFTDVAPGSNVLRQIVPSGYTATPASLTVSVSAGLASETTSFADYTPNSTRTYTNTSAVKTSKRQPNAVSSLTVSDSYTVLGMTLALNVSNQNHNNLTIYLTGPNGTKISLGSTTQSGALSFQVPYFDYTAVKGTWTLEVDGLAGGTLNSWSMNIDGTMS